MRTLLTLLSVLFLLSCGDDTSPEIDGCGIFTYVDGGCSDAGKDAK